MVETPRFLAVNKKQSGNFVREWTYAPIAPKFLLYGVGENPLRSRDAHVVRKHRVYYVIKLLLG